MKPNALLTVFLLASTSLSVFFFTVSPATSAGWSAVYATMKRETSTTAEGGTAFGTATLTPLVHQLGSQSQMEVSLSQPTLAASASLPSPFVVAACIVGLVALFGALLSFFWGRRGKQVSRNRAVGERFWAID